MLYIWFWAKVIPPATWRKLSMPYNGKEGILPSLPSPPRALGWGCSFWKAALCFHMYLHHLDECLWHWQELGLSVPRCPHWSLCAGGWDGPSLACAASEGGSLAVSTTMVTPFFLWPPHACQGRRAAGRDGGNLFHHFGVVWQFSLSPPTSFSIKQF